MPAFASGQLDFISLENRNRVKVGYGHSLNNPDRPEFASPGAAARALFAHALSSLTSGEPGVPQAYWNELKIAASRAARDIAGEKQVRERTLSSIEIAQGALSETINDNQLTGGASAANARRDLYVSIGDRVPRSSRESIVDHLTSRALAEAVNDGNVPPPPTGDRGRLVEELTASPIYGELRDAIRLVYDNTEAAPLDETVIDIDALEDDERDVVLATNEITRTHQTQAILRSFATTTLLIDADRDQTRASGEDHLTSTIFEMETAQEALVMENVVTWTHNHVREHGGRLPTVDETRDGFQAIFAELSKPTLTVREDRQTFGNNTLMARLRRPEGREGYGPTDAYLATALSTRILENDGISTPLQDHNYTDTQVAAVLNGMKKVSANNPEKYAGTAKLLSNLKADPKRDRKWLLITRNQITQRRAIFGKGSSPFEHLNASGIFPSRYFKDHAQITDLVAAAHNANKAIRNKSALIIPALDTDAVKAAIDAATDAGMPVVNLLVEYRRDVSRDAETRDRVNIKELSYNIINEKTGADGKTQIETVPLFSSAGYRATNGALVVLDGKGATSNQSDMVRLDAFGDMAVQIVVAGLGPHNNNRTDFAAARAYRSAVAQNKLAAVLDDNGKELSRVVADKITAPVTLTPLEMATKRLHDIMDKDIMALPVSSAAARLMVHEMHIPSRTSEQLATLSGIDATVGDMFRLPEVAVDGGKNLSEAERQKYKALAGAVTVEAFRLNDIKNVRNITQAATEAFDAIKALKEEQIFNLSFDGAAAKTQPIISAGSGVMPLNNDGVLFIGGKSFPLPEQLHIVDSSVKALAEAGRTIVTTAETGFNLAVIDAAIQHSAPLVVITPQDISKPTTLSPEVAQRLMDVVESHPRGIIAGAYETAAPQPTQSPERDLEAQKRRASTALSDQARERKAIDLAGSITNSAVLGLARSHEYVAYAVAKYGSEKPVAALPGAYRDSANSLLTRDFSALSIKLDRYGTSVTSSFEPSDGASNDQKTVRDKDSGLVLGGDRATRTATWDFGAEQLGENETIEAFVHRFSDQVEAGQATPMVSQTWSEHDRLVAQGIVPANRPGIDDAGHDAGHDRDPSLWDQMINLAAHYNTESTRIAAANAQTMSAAKNRDTGVSL